MTDFVRVKDLDTRHHITVPRHVADASDRLQTLEDRPAVDPFGRPLPAKVQHVSQTPRPEPEPAPDVTEPNAETPATEAADPSEQA